MFLINAIRKIKNSGGERNVQLKKNIALSFVVKGLNILVNFLLVSVSIAYIDQTRYGVWVTLTSILTWLSFFDIGMGNGLRNKLAIAVAQKDYDTAQKYVSTTYAMLACISLLIFIVCFFINPVINWNSFLKIPASVDENIHALLLMVLGGFCIQFVVQLLNIILTAIHEQAVAEFITFLGQAVLLLTILILKHTVPGSLKVLIMAFSFIPVTVIFIASLFSYRTKLKKLTPSVKGIDPKLAKGIFHVGAAFFFIQIGALILFQTDNVIIANIIGPEAVTEFNVAYKLFSVVIIGFSVIMTPFWSAFTEAHAKDDYEWIGASIKRLRKLWLIISLAGVPLLALCARFIFSFWLDGNVTVSNTLTIAMAGYVICYTCLALNCYFLNGIGKLRLQLLLYFVVSATNIPLGIFLAKVWGVEGVVIANIITFVFMNVILWVQTNKIIQKKAAGLWNA